MAASKTIVAIMGPTAVGKTALAIELASKFQTEIISADSRQVYKELNIGTAKPNKAQLELVKHHFIDIISPSESYSAGRFGIEAGQTISSILQQKDLVVIAGGSGLYVQAVLEGFADYPPVLVSLRRNLEMKYMNEGLEELVTQLLLQDPDAGSYVDLRNPRRVIRALELVSTTKKPMEQLRKMDSGTSFDARIVRICLNRPKSELYNSINKRVDEMLEAGLLQEFEELIKKGYSGNEPGFQTVGYKELTQWKRGIWSLELAVEKIKQHSRNFAKRQLTWFRRHPDNIWIESAAPDTVEKIVSEYL